MKENFKASEKDLEDAKVGFEKMAQRLDELYQKDEKDLTAEERKQIALILNNAAVINEILEGKVPEELR